MIRLTAREAVIALDAITHGDQEIAHSEADEILVRAADPAVVAAYQRAVERTGPWWYA